MRLLSLLLACFLAAPGAFCAPDVSADGLLRDHLWRDFTARPADRRPRVGLVLSAGSTRAAAHVGVLQVLRQAGFPVDAVAGTSMGAVFGALYAAGRPIERLWEVGAGLTLQTGSNASSARLISLFLAEKLLSSEKTENLIRTEIGGLRFDQLAKPFACVAMDIYTGETVIFRDGDVASAVRASMNLPGVFAPVSYRQRYLVDGGVVDYIPIDAVKLLGADWILASITEGDYRRARPKTVLDVLEQVIDIRGAFLSREQRKQADFIIEPSVGGIGMYDTDRAREAMEQGVIAANKAVKPAMEELLLFALPVLARDWAGREARP
ncbi:MAG: patatin-like phospholipase family protein [Elusimicrobia bacterium]|nr:patatin-like phospholipase family protein [Elusimicrobiota bacterium]